MYNNLNCRPPICIIYLRNTVLPYYIFWGSCGAKNILIATSWTKTHARILEDGDLGGNEESRNICLKTSNLRSLPVNTGNNSVVLLTVITGTQFRPLFVSVLCCLPVSPCWS